jgi:hypothetical protein
MIHDWGEQGQNLMMALVSAAAFFTRAALRSSF